MTEARTATNYLDSVHISARFPLLHTAMTTTTTCFFIHPSSSYQTPIIGCSAALVVLPATATSPNIHTRAELKCKLQRVHRKWGNGQAKEESKTKKTLGLIVFCDKNANGKSFVPFALVSAPFICWSACGSNSLYIHACVAVRTESKAHECMRIATFLSMANDFISVRLTLSNRFYYAADNKN